MQPAVPRPEIEAVARAAPEALEASRTVALLRAENRELRRELHALRNQVNALDMERRAREMGIASP